jgi:hypothetical protein
MYTLKYEDAEIRRDLKQYVKILKVKILVVRLTSVLYPAKIVEAGTYGDVAKKINADPQIPNKVIIQ